MKGVTEEKDVVTIGGGVCGLACNSELSKDKDISLMMIDNSEPGMSGFRNDGKINVSSEIGFSKKPPISDEEIISIINDNLIGTLSKYISVQKNNIDQYEIKRLEKIAKNNGARFLPALVHHIGTNIGVELMRKVYSDLEYRGVEIRKKSQAFDIKPLDDGKKLVRYTDLETGEEHAVKARNVLVATGRNKGEKFVIHIARKLGIATEQNLGEVGVRVELSSRDYPLTSITYDPKIYVGNARTFCTNPGGYVVAVEKDNEDGITLVNGHALNGKRSENTNFALLVRMESPNKEMNNSEWTRYYASEVCLEGNGKPLAQPLEYFLDRVAPPITSLTNGTNKVKPTLNGFFTGNLAKAMPDPVYNQIRNALITIDMIVADYTNDGRFINSDAIIYGPEAKHCITRVVTNQNYESNIPGIWFGGDASGATRGINAAWVVGYLIAKNMQKK